MKRQMIIGLVMIICVIVTCVVSVYRFGINSNKVEEAVEIENELVEAENGITYYMIDPDDPPLMNMFTRIDDKLILDCYNDTRNWFYKKNRDWNVYSVSSINELHDITKYGKLCYDAWNYKFIDKQGRNRTSELRFRSDKDYIDINSKYLKFLPCIRECHAIDNIRADSKSSAVIYTKACNDESYDEYVNKQEATIDFWLNDEHIEYTCDYPGLSSRTSGYNGRTSASIIILMEDRIIVLIRKLNVLRMICACDDSVIETEIKIEGNCGKQYEELRNAFFCDDGKLWIYLVYREAIENTDNFKFIVMRCRYDEISENTCWQELFSYTSSNFWVSIEWFKDRLLITDGFKIYVYDVSGFDS